MYVESRDKRMGDVKRSLTEGEGVVVTEMAGRERREEGSYIDGGRGRPAPRTLKYPAQGSTAPFATKKLI